MDKNSFLHEFKESFPSQWKELKKLYQYLKIRRALLLASVILIVTAILFYLSSFENNFELSLIPGILAIASFYYAYFQIKNPQILYQDISALCVPLIIHLNTWNIEYEFKAKPHLNEFRASRLYPYTLSNITGKHFFSGIAKKLPFIAWFVEAEYVDKVGESPLSMISSRSAFNGYTGFQIIVKNLVPHLNGIIVIEKGDDEDLIKLEQYYNSDAKWKSLKTDDIGLKRTYNFYTPVENPQNSLDQVIVNKVSKLKSLSSKPFAFSIRRKHIYLNQYWNSDYASFDLKKSLEENIFLFAKKTSELINISYVLALPG